MIITTFLLAIFATLACIGAFSLANFFSKDRRKALVTGLICAIPTLFFVLYINLILIGQIK